ncbi:MAG: aminotransferase class I/II-fold pyridoxal phosphate-dependent enzyme [Synergistales bacterium]|nr:aminotransferase class I/II-fold pyridoxal phosphate-dependent enzyme [Synergistales bacterium]
MLWLKNMVRESVRSIQDNTDGDRSHREKGTKPSFIFPMSPFINRVLPLQSAARSETPLTESAPTTAEGAFLSLKKILGRHYGLSFSEVILGYSTIDILRTLFMCVLNPNDEVLTSFPGRKDLPQLIKSFGARTIEIPLASDLSEELQLFSKFLSEKTRLVFISNPHFPTGTLSYRDELLSFIREMENCQVLIVIDESFSDFSEPSLTIPGNELFRLAGNVSVIRTILALEDPPVAYGFFPRIISENLEKIGKLSPSSFNDLSRAIQILKDERTYMECIATVKAERERLVHRLEMMGVRTLPSQANYLLLSLPEQAEKVYLSLYNDEITVINGQEHHLPGYLITTVGTSERNERFLASIKKVLMDIDT